MIGVTHHLNQYTRSPHSSRMWYSARFSVPHRRKLCTADYYTQLTSPRFQMHHFPCQSSVTGANSRQYCARYHDRSPSVGHYFSLSVSEGSIEIERLSFANTRFKDFRRYAFAQAQAALGGITD